MDKITDLRLAGLRTLASVIERETITDAAAQLGITPSAVSKQITRLEDEVGARLLQRSTRSVRPTEAGLKLYNRTRPLLADLTDAINSVSTEDAQVKGIVRISATPTFGRLHLVPVLAKLSAAHPQLKFDLKMSEKVHDFIEDEIDIAIREGDLDDSNLHSALLREGAVQLYASPAYLRKRGAIESIDDLSQHDLILVPTSALTEGLTNDLRKRLSLAARFIVNDLFSVRDLALAGLGVAGLPDYLAEDCVDSGELVLCLPEFIPMKLPVHAVYPSKRFVSKRIEVVLDEIRSIQGQFSPVLS